MAASSSPCAPSAVAAKKPETPVKAPRPALVILQSDWHDFLAASLPKDFPVRLIDSRENEDSWLRVLPQDRAAWLQLCVARLWLLYPRARDGDNERVRETRLAVGGAITKGPLAFMASRPLHD